LPKGGGAIRGIGEKFSTSAATGTGGLSIPIAVSPGRGGFGPSLSLAYDSGAGNGPFGLGWSLDVPSITRKTDKKLPEYKDSEDSDVFLLSGAEDLVPVLDENGERVRFGLDENGERVRFGEGSESVERFCPRIEGLFARLERRRDTNGNVYWQATTRDNVKSTYGKSEPARIAEPGKPWRIFSWLLERTEDDRGNIVVYSYNAEDVVGVPAELHEQHRRSDLSPVTANRYLKRIEYGNATPFVTGGWLFEVVFDYGDNDPEAPAPDDTGDWSCREDPFSNYRPGFELRTYRLCRRVLMFHRFAELEVDAAPRLVRSTDFVYDADPIATKLQSVAHAGYDKDGTTYVRQALPPVELGYAPVTLNDEVKPFDAASLGQIPAGVDGRAYQWIDLEGEGLPGVLTQQGGALFYKQNLGQAKLAPARALSRQPSMTALGSAGQQLLDVTGDGRPDLVSLGEPMVGYHERTDDDGWSPFRSFRAVPNIDWSDANLRFLDLDGDGFADVLLTDNCALRWYRSEGCDGFGEARFGTKPNDESKGPAIVFADGTQTIFLADMSGDGLLDIVRVRNGEVSYWPNLGYAAFGPKVQMTDAPVFAPTNLFDPRRVRLADIDGSGVTDLLYIGSHGVHVWFNRAGNAWSPGQRLAVFPTAGELSTVDVVDIFGSGTACLVWSTSLPGRSPQMQYVDLLEGKKPHLLTSIKNHLGLETRIQYAPSTRFYLADAQAGAPWATRLPFPVHVVERVETYDAVSRVRFVSTSSYHHGYYDPIEREFRGFGRVEQRDTESFSAFYGQGLFPTMPPPVNDELPQPPVVTKTWMHTGAWQKQKALTDAFAAEYYNGDEFAPRLPAVPMPVSLSADELAEAHRALKGKVLRTEVYAEDGTGATSHPYLVTEAAYEVRRVQPRDEQPHGVFHCVPRESVTVHYERDPEDPRVTHEVALAVDDFGHVTRSASIAYPRRHVPAAPPSLAEQGRTAVVITETTLANESEQASWYRLGVPLASRTYHVTGLEPAAGVLLTFAELTTAASYDEAAYEELAVPNVAQRRLIASTRTRYWNDDLSLALPYESYAMAFTPLTFADEGFETRVTSAILDEGGYLDLDDDGHRWVRSGHQVFSAAAFYQVAAVVDAFGNQTTITYDGHDLLVTATQAPLGLTVTAQHDYRVLGPWQVTDPNGNRSQVAYDPLGRLIKTALLGKVGDSGDTLEDPTTTIEYALDRFKDEGKPVYVKTRARERHADTSTRWQESYSYSDGSGHEVMRKIQAEPTLAMDPRWVGTGRTVFDNKGNPVKKYEPFFSATSEYETDEAVAAVGVTPILHYDPLGRLLRVDLPNGTFTKVAFTPWQQTSWDENDTVLHEGNRWYIARAPDETPPLSAAERRAARVTARQQGSELSPPNPDGTPTVTHGTPTVTHVDPLGRAFLVIADNGEGDTHATRTALDIQGNPLSITDALGRAAMRHMSDDPANPPRPFFSMLGATLKQVSIDAGTRWLLPDVAGKPLRQWDQRGHAIRTTYDALQRPTRLFVQKGSDPEFLAERTVYGEAVTDAADLNLRGKVYQTYDGAGVITNGSYDFKGNLLASSRRLATAYATQVDWDALASLTDPADILAEAESQLEAETFTTTTAYDALNRPTSLTTPDASEIKPAYNEAGLLEAVEVRIRGAVGWTRFVDDIAYDAKGRRARIDYGNGTFTEYAYDELTFRLTRLKTQRTSDNATLQDLNYTYDPVGNIVAIEDAAQKTVFFNNAVIDSSSEYEYDAVYRLKSATGREHASLGTAPRNHNDVPLKNLPHANDAQALRRYEEQYQYDEVGNLKKMLHYAGVSNVDSWTRGYDYPAPGPGSSNRLRATSQDSDDPDDPENFSALYTYDAHGNMTTMPHLTGIAWDFKDQMRSVDKGGGGDVYFTYDASGSRVRKVWVHGGIVEERIYLGAYEIYRRHESASLHTERQTLHVMDDARRIAMVETKTVDTEGGGTGVRRIRYQYANHLDSALVECDATGLVISYEEYHPYGTTAYWSATSAIEVSQRRHRYTGKEKDEETGLYYHGARYYAPWLGRWTSADPAGMVDGLNLYGYCRGNPVRLHDPNGREGADTNPEINNIFRGLAAARATVSAEEFHRFLGKNEKAVFELLHPFGYAGSKKSAEASLKDFDRAYATWRKIVDGAAAAHSMTAEAPPDPRDEEARARMKMWATAGGDSVAAVFVGTGAFVSATVGRLFGFEQDPRKAAASARATSIIVHSVGAAGVNRAAGQSSGASRSSVRDPRQTQWGAPTEPTGGTGVNALRGPNALRAPMIAGATPRTELLGTRLLEGQKHLGGDCVVAARTAAEALGLPTKTLVEGSSPGIFAVHLRYPQLGDKNHYAVQLADGRIVDMSLLGNIETHRGNVPLPAAERAALKGIDTFTPEQYAAILEKYFN
jgi:RHS repeat-associated protein